MPDSDYTFDPDYDPTSELSPEPTAEAGTPAVEPTAEAGTPVVEPAAEAEPTAEAGTPAVEPTADKPVAGHMIPKTRYDSAKTRLGQAELRAQELEAKLAAIEAKSDTPTIDPIEAMDAKLAELDVKYAKALADGNHEEAAGYMREGRQIERESFQQQLAEASTATNSRTMENLQYDDILGAMEEAYPATNPDHNDYDEALVAELSDLKAAFVASGLPESAALKRAAGYVLSAPTAAAPAVAPVEPKKTDVAANLAAAAAQPASLAAAGANSDTGGAGKGINIMKMSDAEFDKLSEGDLAVLRGDQV